MKLSDVYSYLIANWLNGGSFITRSKMKSTDIRPEYNMIFTKNHVKKVFRVSGIKPDNLDICFVDFLRDRMFELHPDVECIINISSHPVTVDIAGDKFTRAMGRASEAYNTYREAFESQKGLDRLTGKTYRLPNGARLKLSRERMDDLYQVFSSYLYLFNHLSGGGTTSLTEIFIEIASSDVKAVRLASRDLPGVLGPLCVGCEELKATNKAYLKEFGPAAGPARTLNKKFLPQLLFTEENTAAFSSYKSRGLVGGKGLLLGMTYRSRLPFSADIFAAPAAQVFLLAGKTGSGKTYAAFQAAISALAQGQYVTAIDIKGREWAKLSSLVETKILTFDERHPSFVNTMRLDDIGASNVNSEELFNTAVKGTVTLLMLIVNLQEGEGNPSDLELVIREAVMKLYSMRGVEPGNPKSFAGSKDLHYADILPILEELSTTATYTTAQKKMVGVARSRCHAYLGSSGIFSDAFRNEITLGDVMNTPLVIYEFNKNQNAMTDSLDVIRIFMVQFLDSKKKAMLKEKQKFLFCFYEELQRCEQFGNLLEYICGDVTGSRSNNAVIFLLLNSLKVLQGQRAQDIRSNITSFIVGSVAQNDIVSLREDFNQPWVAHQLELFAERPNDFRNCFAAAVDTGAETYETVYKVEFPEYLQRSFQTRTTLENGITVA